MHLTHLLNLATGLFLLYCELINSQSSSSIKSISALPSDSRIQNESSRSHAFLSTGIHDLNSSSASTTNFTFSPKSGSSSSRWSNSTSQRPGITKSTNGIAFLPNPSQLSPKYSNSTRVSTSQRATSLGISSTMTKASLSSESPTSDPVLSSHLTSLGFSTSQQSDSEVTNSGMVQQPLASSKTTQQTDPNLMTSDLSSQLGIISQTGLTSAKSSTVLPAYPTLITNSSRSYSETYTPSISSSSDSTFIPTPTSSIRSKVLPATSVAPEISEKSKETRIVTSTIASEEPQSSKGPKPTGFDDWEPTRSSGSVTVDSITFSFDFLHKPKHEDDDGKAKSPAVAFHGLSSLMSKTAGHLDLLKSGFTAFKGIVEGVGATNEAVAAAGSHLPDLFTNAFSSAAIVGNSFNDIELDLLDTSGSAIKNLPKEVQHAQELIMQLGEAFKNVNPLIKSKLNLANGKKVLILGGVVLGESYLATMLRKFAALPLLAAQTPSRSLMPSATPPTATTSSSSSPTATTKQYFVRTYRGTKLEDYNTFVKSLPDKGEGIRIVYPSLDSQSYLTHLTAEEAGAVKKNPLIEFVMPNTARPDPDMGLYSVIPAEKFRRMNQPLNLVQQIHPSRPYLDILSQGPRNARARTGQHNDPLVPPYLLSPKAGAGTTIFVIDSGVDMNHPELVDSVTPNDWFVVQNSRMDLPSSNIQQIPYVPLPDTAMADARNHGTSVASVATGRTVGVAKKAHLVPIRYQNTKWQATEGAIDDAFRYVIDRAKVTNIERRALGIPPGWAVINFSGGFSRKNGIYGYPSGEWEARRGLLDRLLQECWQNDIVTVFAVGNDGIDSTFDTTQGIPSCLAKEDNPLIIVGATDIHGVRWGMTTRDRDGKITLSAPGIDIQCANPGTSGLQTQSGTSFAAPMISGLAAYFLSLNSQELAGEPGGGGLLGQVSGEGPDLHIQGQVAQLVKNYLIKMSYIRDSTNSESVKVGYNGAEEGLCTVVRPNQIPKRYFKELLSRATNDDFELKPVVVDGILIDESYPMPTTCPKPSSSSQTTRTSSHTSRSSSAITPAPTTSSTTSGTSKPSTKISSHMTEHANWSPPITPPASFTTQDGAKSSGITSEANLLLDFVSHNAAAVASKASADATAAKSSEITSEANLLLEFVSRNAAAVASKASADAAAASKSSADAALESEQVSTTQPQSEEPTQIESTVAPEPPVVPPSTAIEEPPRPSKLCFPAPGPAIVPVPCY